MSVPLAYLGVIVIWSTTPLAIKWSSEAGGFLLGVSGRMILGALLCLLIVQFGKIAMPWDRRSVQSYIAISMAVYGAMLSTYWGAQYIPSGLISVLFGFTPVMTSLLTFVLLKENGFSLPKWLGMGLGIIGLGIIFQHDIQEDSSNVKGLIAVLIAVLLHALSSVWIKRLHLNISPIAMTTGGLLLAVPLYLLTWIFIGVQVPSYVPVRAVLSILYLSIFGSVIGFILYYYLLQHIDANKTALITLITPITALLLGGYLNGEIVASTVWIGTVLVLQGLAVYQFGGYFMMKLRNIMS
jgi:drug/metabolite transporter (DMT)-like permease